MEAAQQMQPRRPKRKAAEATSPPPSLLPSSSSVHNHGTLLFPQLLAAYANIHRPHSRALIRRLLQTHLALIRRTSSNRRRRTNVLPLGLLSLLPSLLTTKYTSVALLAAETVGVIALSSLEANAEVATDREIVNGLATVLRDWKRTKKKVVMAVCNAVLDLSTSQAARERLFDSPALVELLSVLCQVAAPAVQSSSAASALKEGDDCSRSGFMNDRLSVLVLDLTLALINTCNEKMLAKIPGGMSKATVILLKGIWHKSRGGKSQSKCTSRKHDLAEATFRLSMNEANYLSCQPDAVRRSMLGNDSSFEYFLLNYWEEAHFLVRSPLKNSEDLHGMLSSLCNFFNARTSDEVLDSILQGQISCPPIGSDELDILNFLKEVKGLLGSPMLYGQDIRAVKTQRTFAQTAHRHREEEILFSMETDSTINSSKAVYIDDIEKCKQAFLEGYTIALRGLEFRCEKIATIADGFATLFGQPSVGANVYLTPPGSQGLSRHYDDHCVFVCQLRGHKQWFVFNRYASILPRLYEPLGNLSDLDGDGKTFEGKEFILQEGDILYIPRGYPHEAYTTIYDNRSEESDGFSLHLTLAIEVEPPFEWEGFAHIALHCWNEKQKQACCNLSNSTQLIPDVMFVNLLHVAIRMIGNYEPIFRKACMVGAFFSVTDNERENHISNCQSVFYHIIDKIDAKSSFLEAFKSVENIVSERNDESFHWLSWLRHLPQEGCENEKTDFNNLFEVFEGFIQLSEQNIHDTEAAFMRVKSKFCRQVVFEDACKNFKILLEKYRKTRKQYMNGMLSLHSNV